MADDEEQENRATLRRGLDDAGDDRRRGVRLRRLLFRAVVLDVVPAEGNSARCADGAVHPFRILDQRFGPPAGVAASYSASTRPCCRSASHSGRGSTRKWAAPGSCHSASPSHWCCWQQSRCLRPPGKPRRSTRRRGHTGSCATSGWCRPPPPRCWCSARWRPAASRCSRSTATVSAIPRRMPRCSCR